jgi:hypothetical protein
MANCVPPAERAGKGKAEDDAAPRDKEPRLASSAVQHRSKAMYIHLDESSKLMRICEESRTAALAKNRRVTVASGEARETDHSEHVKRAAPAAAPSVGNSGVFSFSLCESMQVRHALYVTVIANWRSLLCFR